MSRFRHATNNDDGVSLVLALIFIVVVALFATVALDKAASTSQSGQQLRDRGKLQYALDGAIDRALQVLKKDIAGQAPGSPATLCASPAAAADITQEAGGLVLNDHTVRYSCQTLAGKTAPDDPALDTNFAIVLTSTASNALDTSSGLAAGQGATCASPGSPLKVTGPIYLRGFENNTGAAKRLLVCGGDYVRYKSSSPACTSAELTALTNVVVDTGSLKGCTEQTVDQAVAAYTLPTAPTQASNGFYLDVPAGIGSNPPVCRVFYPGLYPAAPAVRSNTADANYFVSGLYYFQFNGQWAIGSNTTVIAGTKQEPTDVGVSAADGASTACAGVTDAIAMAGLSSVLPVGLTQAGVTNYYFNTGGAQFVFGFKATLSNAGYLTMYNPVPPSSTTPALNFVAVRGATDPGQASGAGDIARGYQKWQEPNDPVLSNQSASSAMIINGKVMAPSAPVQLSASNPTDGVVRGGLIAKTLDLGASVTGGGLALSTPSYTSNPAPPPYRTVRIVASEPGGSADTNVAVATISNYSPFTVTVKSWRTG